MKRKEYDEYDSTFDELFFIKRKGERNDSILTKKMR